MTPHARFHLYTLAELEALPATADLVERLVAEDALAVLYGASGVGKSFAALSLAICVSEGIPFLGKAVRSGPVIIVLMEGSGRYPARIRAACQAVDREAPSQLYVVRDPFYPHDAKSVTAYIAAVREQRQGAPVALTILDTLARASAGSDENNNAHRALTADGLRSIQAATGGAVLAIGHTGWNETRLRGGYDLQASCDTILRLSQDDAGLVLEAEKVRDEEAGERWHVALTPQAGSMVFGPSDAVEASGARLNAKALKALEALAGVAMSDGVGASVWERASGLPGSSFYRIRKQLVVGGQVMTVGHGKYTVSVEGRELLSLPNHSHGTPMEAGKTTPITSTPLLRGGSGSKPGSERTRVAAGI